MNVPAREMEAKFRRSMNRTLKQCPTTLDERASYGRQAS